jgi:LysM repeat protein
MRYLFKTLLLLLLVLLYSCSSARKTGTAVVPAASMPEYAADYLNKYGMMAVSEMQRTGIPASITLAQGMLESDYGRSYLARKANNHFGIKCHSDWKGGKVYKDDDRKNECFRSYRNADESYRDHSDFLVTGSRYSDLFKLSSTDYKGWAHGLKKAGYATDPNYASLLIRKIDEYGLHAYDEVSNNRTGKGKTDTVAVKPQAAQVQTPAAALPAAAVVTKDIDTTITVSTNQETAPVITFGTKRTGINNGVKYVVVRDGDTFGSLAREFELLAWEISRFNDLPSDAILQAGQIIYLEPKRNKAKEGDSVHVVQPGETMHILSQRYAIKLSSLYKMNMIEEDKECVTGQKVRIR